jgi:toxin secretion/phage lysis holin
MRVTKDDMLYGAKWLAAFGLGQWAALPPTVTALIGFMGMDIVTGIAAAYVQHRVSSDASIRGLVKKLMVLLAVWFSHMLTGTFSLPFEASGVIALGFIANECISIVENFGNAGVPIPEQWVDVLKRFQKLKPVVERRVDQPTGSQ